MEYSVYWKLSALAAQPEAQEATVCYLAQHLRFLKKQEKVLICFPEYSEASLGGLMAQAVRCCGAEPVIWQGDLRWKTLLRLAFSSRAGTVIGAPLVIMGLAKISRINGVPLFIRNVVCAGYPCLDWMIDGIIKGLDCRAWGCFDVHMSNIVAGFSCSRSRGVHIREDAYGVDIVDDGGVSLAPGQMGNIVLYPLAQPGLRFFQGDRGRIETAPCPCGSTKWRLMDMEPGKHIDTDLMELGQRLQSWSSVLDCRLRKGNYGLEVELVVFPGEKLPELPTCAKRIIRPWDPERDEPLFYIPTVEKI